jgi:hypothetical protein
MAVPTKPALTLALGKDGWGFIVACANIQAPTIIELNAATGFSLSCSLFSEQEGVTATTEKVTLPRLLCETVQFQVNGPVTYEMADLTVSFNPQGAAASAGVKAWETMVDNATGFLWQRQGIDSTTDNVAAQFYNIIPVQLGTKTPIKTSTGGDGVFAFTQPASITAKPAFKVAAV